MRFSRALICIAGLMLPMSATADDLETQARALKVIRETAADICNTVAQEGTSQLLELSGNVKAKLGGAVAKIADLGIEGAGKYRTEEFKGLLQQELATAIKDNANCRLEVLKLLQEKMLIKRGGVSQDFGEARLEAVARRPGSFKLFTPGFFFPQNSYPTLNFTIENVSGLAVGIGVVEGESSVGPCSGASGIGGLPRVLRGRDIIEPVGTLHLSDLPTNANLLPFLPIGGKVSGTVQFYNCDGSMFSGMDSIATMVTVVLATKDEVITLPLSHTLIRSPRN
jgi:hypothetical protein